MLGIKDIIRKLQELEDKDYIVHFEADPSIDCFENLSGEGIEKARYTYNITITQKNPYVRKYKNINGIREYYNEKDMKEDVK